MPETIYEVKLLHVLIVDDDRDLLDTLKTLLESKDCLVSTATNGVEALKLIMHMDVDIILCDLLMPSMAGDMFYAAVERVKPKLCSRFIFVTGYEGHPKFAAFLEKSKAVVLYKPITLGKLTGTMRIVLDRAAAERKQNGMG